MKTFVKSRAVPLPGEYATEAAGLRWMADAGVRVPEVAIALNGGVAPELVWRNQLDGLTFRVQDGYLKWNPRVSGVDLGRERRRGGGGVEARQQGGDHEKCGRGSAAPKPGMHRVCDSRRWRVHARTAQSRRERCRKRWRQGHRKMIACTPGGPGL